MAARVRDRQRYAAPDSDAITQTLSVDGESGMVDACHLSWDGLTGILHGDASVHGPAPGPQLGRLFLARALGQGYQIVGFTPC
jgi:hypothetical protein